ncbi:MAG: Uma2 family endonuclease [Bacteroidota bacterium]
MELSSLDTNKSYTYADYLNWNFKERVELIKGKLFKMSPAPNRLHQDLSTFIQGSLYIFLQGKKCKLYTAPFDVRLLGKTADDKDIITVVQPDICVICDESKLDFRGCLGAPDLVVEILSPGNNATEVRNKYSIYEQSGVKEYLVVSPQDRTFIAYTLVNGSYVTSRLMAEGDIFKSTVLDGFSMDLKQMFDTIS